jgi:hypothetical protein
MVARAAEALAGMAAWTAFLGSVAYFLVSV